jgi:hypothetical protein
MPRILPGNRSDVTTARLGGVLLVLVLSLAASRAALSQSTPDIVRGRVISDSSRAIAGATVIVTRGPDRLVQRDTTDASGSFSLKFDPGTGDYLVFVAAPGYTSARRRVQRQNTEHELVADFVLKLDLARLDTVTVHATKPVRANTVVNRFQEEPGSAEQWDEGIAGRIPPTMAGDLNSIMGTMSNITMAGDGPSVLGSAAGSNLTTLNGSAMAAGSIPRAAQTRTRVTTATFDPTRGGFSGANIDLELGPGNRMFQNRRAYLTLDPSVLQSTDEIGRATGAVTSGIRGSLGADGELIRHVLTYNVAVDYAHRVSRSANLLSANDDVLARAGIVRDSVSRLVSIAGPLGLSLRGSGIPSDIRTDAFTWLGRLDDTRDSLNTRTLTTYATLNRGVGLGIGPSSVPSTASRNTQQTFGAQLMLGNYVGQGRRVLTETRLSASSVRNRATPYEQLPSASVLVLSPDANAGINATGITLGGGQLTTNDSHWTVEGSNLTAWNTNGRRNQFKAQFWGRIDGLKQSAVSNLLGSYSFNSLGDLAAGNASSFSRTLVQPPRSGTVWNAAMALAHQWAPSRTFSILYGARLEASGFASRPSRNPQLESELGVRTDVAPARFHISPRAGFSYTYNTARSNYALLKASNVGQFFRPVIGVVRGGIGEFRDLLQPGILANARAATGLPDGTSRLSCIGSAVPYPDWSQFASDPASVPTTCTDGSGLLADYAPPVSFLSPSYDVPRSWRASLDWKSSFGSWLVKVAALGSYNISQPGTINVNFAGTPRFTLAGENNRPVFVSTAAIDAQSGNVSPTEGRKSQQFGSVSMLTSDLRGYGGQITTTVAPDISTFKSHYQLFTSLSYTLQTVRRQYRGFDGAAFGDPRLKEWAPSSRDARNIFVFTLGLGVPKVGTVTMFARAQSGLPFTPIVQGDVNGDGQWGDRAFIPNPATESDPALATQISSLLASGSGVAKKCLRSYLGSVAARNGCRGPWTGLLNMQWNPPVPKRWADRVTPSIYFENVLGGIDQLVHGRENLHGWGGQATVNPVLLVPRAFDPVAQRFSYNVNPRFADTRIANTLARSPFRVTIDFSFNLSVNYALQQLRRAIEPVRDPNGKWTRRSADAIVAMYIARSPDLYERVLSNSDSLFLTRQQIAGLQHNDSTYLAQVRAIYMPMARTLAAGKTRNPGEGELKLVKQATSKAGELYTDQMFVVDSIITPLQRSMLPIVNMMLTGAAASRSRAAKPKATAKPAAAKPAAAKPADPAPAIQAVHAVRKKPANPGTPATPTDRPEQRSKPSR